MTVAWARSRRSTSSFISRSSSSSCPAVSTCREALITYQYLAALHEPSQGWAMQRILLLVAHMEVQTSLLAWSGSP